jgi:hypothetical protein
MSQSQTSWIETYIHALQAACRIPYTSAAIYLTLKDIVRSIGPQFSPIQPTLYPWVFILCDLLSLVLQAAGGGIAAPANSPSSSGAGGNIMPAGIVFQVATFAALYILALVFIRNLRTTNTP